MDLNPTPDNPVPAGAVSGEITAKDGVSLRFARFPPTARRRGTVCVFTGRAESIEKYFEVIEELRARGFAVAMVDWRGQGGSQRLLPDARKGWVRAFSDYQFDLEAFVREIVLPDCPPPYFALCHSTGAAILLHAVKAGRRWFDRLVIASPLIDLAHPRRDAVRLAVRWGRRLGLGTRYLPGGGATPIANLPFPGNKLSSDAARYRRNAEIVDTHPHLGLGSPTVQWLDEAFTAMEPFADPAFPSSFRQPTLAILAGDDRIVSTRAAELFAIRLLAGTGLVIPGARHEILQERDPVRAQFWAAFDAFVPGTPP